jgi:chaperone modulatory protein CbpM
MSPLEIHSLEVARIEIVDDAAPVQLVEVLTAIRIERTHLVEMVEAGVVSPLVSSTGPSTTPSSAINIEQWQFARRDLRRLRAAQRLIADLQVNVAGAALILDLIDERDALLKSVRLLRALGDEG